MGLIKAASGAIGGMLADQWKDFFTVPEGISNTAAVFPAVLRGTNAGRGSNIRQSSNIISNGSKIVIPEGYVLLTFQDGAVTSIATEPGAYIWDSEDINSQSIFAGDGFIDPLIIQSWERFKYGGIPGSQQIAIFVNAQELPNNKFGTQSEIYWDDAYLNTQVGALTRGSYTLKIVDPVLFVKNFVPAAVLQNLETFDFTDSANPQATQIFSEVVSVLASAFSAFTNLAAQENRIANIQRDSVGFASTLSEAVEEAYSWRASRGIEISKVAIVAIEYDEVTKELLKSVQRADALSGTRGNVNLQASVAEGIQNAGSTGGAAGIMGLGIAGGSIGLSGLQQPETNPSTEDPRSSNEGESTGIVGRMTELKKLLDLGLITDADFEQAKNKLMNSLG